MGLETVQLPRKSGSKFTTLLTLKPSAASFSLGLEEKRSFFALFTALQKQLLLGQEMENQWTGTQMDLSLKAKGTDTA